jgi:hypothetical protein
MGKPPTNPRRPTRRRRRATRKTKSVTGRVMSVAAGVTAAAGVYTELAMTSPPGVVCGGSERWNVKVAKDSDAAGGKVDLNADKSYSVAEINQQVRPAPFDPAGRMTTETKEYTVRGYLSYFIKEADRDYHVVITQQPAAYANGKTPAQGQSMVVEFPDPACFGGKPEVGSHTSALGQLIAGARQTFKEQTKGVSGEHIAQAIPVTVTGVGFFDRFTPNSHEPTGHSMVYAQPDGRQVVLELHPVTEITFDNAPPDNS